MPSPPNSDLVGLNRTQALDAFKIPKVFQCVAKTKSHCPKEAYNPATALLS